MGQTRARKPYGIPTAGSIENVRRLTAGSGRCTEIFAQIQDGTPVPADTGLELLGRLPEPESLFLLGRRGHTFQRFSDLRGASIGIGPDGSGTASPVRQLFDQLDFRAFDINLSYHDLRKQAQLVAESKLDVAAVVMQENAELLRTLIREYSLDIVAPKDLQGIVARYPWLSLGHLPVAQYELTPPIPPAEKPIHASRRWLSRATALSGQTGSRCLCCSGRSSQV